MFESHFAENALNDPKIRNAFNAIHTKNIKISYLFV